ncbi:alpha/beta hydrolase [Tissierella praeacuta]|uniref:alpha/beta fold hydrolase n=1 Tax=Tissierella praeacuta TaxID=43131 RepID=UPI00333FF68E
MDIEGLNLNYIVEGEGKDVLVLHGWGANIDTVLPIVNILKEKFRVHALDLPGFGKSQEPNEPIDSFKYAEIVKKYMDNMKLKNVILIGHSFGGKLSIILGNRYPEMIEKIVLVNSAGLIPKRGIKYYTKVYSFKFMKFLYKSFFFWLKNEEMMERFYKRFGSTDYKDSSGVMRKILVIVVNENLLPLLSKIEAPTLLIWGDKDTATPLYMGKIMEKEIRDSGLVVLENTGHFSYLDDYQRFTIILRNFLQYNEE